MTPTTRALSSAPYRAFVTCARLALGANSNADDAAREATRDDDEDPWRRRATHHASTPSRASWSTTSMTTDARDGRNVIARGELDAVARLANLRPPEEEEEGFARDVEEIVRAAGRLDAAAEARDDEDARPMWTTRETSEGGGDGLRMRVDAAARVNGEVGERETARAERERLLGEAAFGTREFRYVAPRSAIEE